MIAVDTSVWIDHLNNVPTPQVACLRDLVANHRDIIAVGDIVLCEVLQGLASHSDAAMVEAALRRFEIVAMVGRANAIKAAENYRILRSRGIAVRRTIDMLIGTYCLESGLKLLHADRDFDHMQIHLGLAVVAT